MMPGLLRKPNRGEAGFRRLLVSEEFVAVEISVEGGGGELLQKFLVGVFLYGFSRLYPRRICVG